MIYFILPVHKNYHDCESFVYKTSKQLKYYNVRFIIVNTFEKHYLKLVENLKTNVGHSTLILKGKSGWYWFKSIHNGLRVIENEVQENDIVILCNVDVEVPYDYIKSITLLQERYPKCIIGSQLRSLNNFNKLDLGPKVIQKYLIRTLRENEIDYFPDGTTYELDFTSGRGMIFQGSHVTELLKLKFKMAPHYYSDYCLSLAMVRQGYKIIMSNSVYILSQEKFGNSNYSYNFFDLLFSKKNPYYLPASLTFFYTYHKKFKNVSFYQFFISYVAYSFRRYIKILKMSVFKRGVFMR